MIIQPNSTVTANSTAVNPNTKRQSPAAESGQFADKVTISQTARELSISNKGNDTNSIDASPNKAKFTGFKGTFEHHDFLIATDKKFAGIMEKPSNDRTSSELEYVAKTTGLPNMMASLSSQEKNLHNKLVANGHSDAAMGIRHIGAIRSGTIVGGVPGKTYDAINTTITPNNIKDFFIHSIRDPSGVTQKHFDALIAYLEG